jgi:hypothetical protein
MSLPRNPISLAALLDWELVKLYNSSLEKDLLLTLPWATDHKILKWRQKKQIIFRSVHLLQRHEVLHAADQMSLQWTRKHRVLLMALLL